MFTKSLTLIGGFLLASSVYAACPAGTDDLSATYPAGLPDSKLALKPVCGLTGNHVANLNLTSANVFLLNGGVYIGDDINETTITLAAGTTVRGKEGRDFLAIRRGSKIFVQGTEANPVVMTGFDPAKTTRGQWGGLVLNGRAPINQCKNPGAAVCENEPEGGVVATYGGSDADDNSGSLEYLRIEYPGFEVSPNNELNGITFNGVGRGTLVDHVQVFGSNDDGIEFFGGTVDIKHVLISGAQDDGLDWDFGWSGRGQYVIVQQDRDDGNNGIEADNNVNNNAALPRSNPTFANLTLIGGSPKAGNGMLLRRGTGARFYNTVVTGFATSCIDFDDAETFANAAITTGSAFTATGIVMEGSVVSCGTQFAVKDGDPYAISSWFTAQPNRQEAPALLGYLPADENSALYTDAVELSAISDFFEDSGFVGGVENISSATADWTQVWTKKSAL